MFNWNNLKDKAKVIGQTANKMAKDFIIQDEEGN